ncbi:MAG: oligopeptide/dipeptide ABC transporter ATP-binding protein [Pseudomonadota bacterium]|nr:oligopeptide/dipeptide ABC transporter ATP-binding protein [Pseudomonadota bacterium]
MNAPLLRVRDMVMEFPVGRGTVHAVSGVSFDLARGETLALVGESGCGKSTTARAVMQLPPPTGGSVELNGVDLTRQRGSSLRSLRRQFQMIFQNPISSLNPRKRVAEIVAKPLAVAGIGTPASRRERVAEVLDTVGLDPAIAMDKRPHEFSGGQCQRISIARALVLEPDLLICDEPVSALDVSIQAQILNLLEDMKTRFDLTMLFISHDLAVVRNVADRVAVMYLGRFCEVGRSELLYARPAHPYTRALLSAIPVPDPTVTPRPVELVEGDLPSPLAPPSGCRFRTRCPLASERCAREVPELRDLPDGRAVACHFPLVEH